MVRELADPYHVLGVARGATDAEIKAAHRRLAKRYHPDAPGGDTVRFLAVHEAYKLLSDPLQRRDWDARHAPGPVRASQRAQPRPRAANGRWTKAQEPATQGTDGSAADGAAREQAARDPASRTYTWSASEVPWWEDPGPRDSRRQTGHRRPRDAGAAAGADRASRPAGPARPAPDGAPGAAPRGARPDEPVGPTADARRASQDFDVYSRSSGAAWSMAARAYFRRGDSDLPRRGSFQRQGTQPLTAARARMAAEEEARRTRAHGRGQGREPAPAASAAGSPGRAGARPSFVAPATAPPVAGVTRDAQTIGELRAAARARFRAARWPSLTQRLGYALLAWLPVALGIGFAGGVVTGCDRGLVGCPEYWPLLQTVATALSLGLLVALPRLAYALAVGTIGVVLAGIAIVVTIWALGLRPPLPAAVLLLSSAVLLIVHLAIAAWVLSGSRQRPWARGIERRRRVPR